MNHTTLPWIALNSTDNNDELCYDLCGKDSNGYDYLGEIVNKNNAKFIVKAVNSHYQLLEALKDMTAIFETDYPQKEKDEIFDAAQLLAIQNAKKAIEGVN